MTQPASFQTAARMPPVAGPCRGEAAPDRAAPSVETVHESFCQFGNGGQLIGTITHGAGPGERKPDVGVLLFNAGTIARMGPHRFNVKLARRLARLGHSSLRFDLSGQGDSGAAPGTLGYHEQTGQDIRDATDRLAQAAGVRRFVIVGICSAAQAGWHAALRDPRIVGLVMIDGHAYPTRWTPLVHRWRRRRERSFGEQLERIGRKLRGRLFGDSSFVEPIGRLGGDDVPVAVTTRDEYARGMQALADRGTRSMLVFTSSWSPFYSYPGQFAAVFGRHPFCRSVRCVFAPQFDHTLTLLESQDTMMEWIEEWIARC
ncbi:MAG: alpha/beta fold hydrolase [Burkholderiaceae bacterium]